MITAFLKTGLLAGLFFTQASATTFGPIGVVDQAENASYAIRGRILGASWVKAAPDVRQPYTYWRVRISSQTRGDPLGAEITVRQPGGEIGERGYHMAGTAEFSANEDVFLMLHDTPAPEASDVKELVGLASGKYKVETGANGKQTVVNGLGLPVVGASGNPFSPDEFQDLLVRISKNEATQQDRNIFVNRIAAHEHAEAEEEAQKAREEALKPLLARSPADTQATATSAQSKSTTSEPASRNSVQERASGSEESSTGFAAGSWMAALALVAGLLVGLYFVLKR